MNTPVQPPQFQDEERLDLPSASSMEISVLCPGQLALKSSLPPEAFNKKNDLLDQWAERGTRIHLAFETGDVSALDEEERNTYEIGVKFEESIVQTWMRDKNLSDCAEGPREFRVFLNNPETLSPIGSAKADRHYIAPPYLLVIDFKSGWNPNLPPSPKSWQLRFQAVSLWQEYIDMGITEVRVAHCKPKSSFGAGDACDYSQQDLEKAMQAILFHLWESAQEGAPRHAGHWCNWCPCKAYCAEAGGFSMLPTVIAKQDPASTRMSWEGMVSSMKPDDLVRIWENSSVITKIIDAVKDRLKSMPEEELAKLGIKLGVGRSMTTIEDTPNAFRYLQSQFADEEEVLKMVRISKAAVVAGFKQSRGVSKQVAEEWFEANFQRWISKSESAAPLARIK